MGPRQMSVCFSGYRPEKLPWGEDESDPRCAALKKRLYDAAESACAQGYRHFICGMARGVDFYACEAVLLLRRDYPDVTVEAAIPRFKASSSLELSDALKAMGVTDAFDSTAADLRAMGGAPNDQLYVSAVLHKTYLELDENGTKAAAVTAVVNEAACAEPPEVHRVVLDRPFVYMIVDTHANLPLFLGTVTQMDG